MFALLGVFFLIWRLELRSELYRLKNIIFKFNYFGSLSQAEFELKIQMLEAWFYFSTSDLRKNIDFIVNMDILFDFPILVYKIFVRIEKSFSCINTLLL